MKNKISEFHAKRLGYIVPINWLMKIAENLREFRQKSGVITDIEVQNPKTEEKLIVKALWDTGATYTCLSSDLVEKMKLEQVGTYELVGPLKVHNNIPNWIISLKVHPEKSPYYQIKAGTFEGHPDFDVILGLDTLLKGKLTMWVENGVFNFEFIENINKL